MKKVLALALVAVMMMALCGVAFADATTINVTNNNSHISIVGKTYTAWKLFDAVYTAGGTNVSYTMSTSSYFYTESDILDVLDNYFTFTAIPGDDTKVVVAKNGNWDDARDLADDMEQYLTSSVPSALVFTSPAATTETATITVDGPGYFLITGTAASKADSTKTINSAVAAVSVNTTKEIHPKADVPTLTKVISDGTTLDDAGKQAIAQVGTSVEFTLTSAVPDTTGYTTYIFTIHDTMTSGLTYNNDVAVTIDGVSYTGGTFDFNSNTNSFTYTIPKDDLTPAGAPIVLIYSATVNSSAVTTDFERNTAYLEYSNNPYDDSDKDTTPEEHVYVIDLNIDVDKVAETTGGSPLAGAKFKLYKVESVSGTNTTYWYKWDATNGKVVWVTDIDEASEYTTNASGHLDTQFQGLTVGTYYLRETVPPTGYNILTTDPEIEITADDQDATHAVVKADGETVVNGSVTLTTSTHTDAQPVAHEEVINKSGVELPSTGGIGTTIFYVAGLIMVLGAATILIARRKADAE